MSAVDSRNPDFYTVDNFGAGKLHRIPKAFILYKVA